MIALFALLTIVAPSQTLAPYVARAADKGFKIESAEIVKGWPKDWGVLKMNDVPPQEVERVLLKRSTKKPRNGGTYFARAIVERYDFATKEAAATALVAFRSERSAKPELH